MALQMIYVDDAAPGACGDAGIVYNGSTTLTASKIIAGTSMTMSGTAAITGNTTIGGTLVTTGNSTSSGTSTLTGNVSCGGTLAVTGTSTLTGNVAAGGTLAVTGATTLTGALQCNESVTIATTKNLVMTSDSDILVNTDKFTVAGSTGNTVIAGTLGVTGASTFTGDIASNGHLTIATTKNLVGGADTDILINTDKFTVAGATGNTLIAGTATITGNATHSGAMIMSAAEVAAASGAYAVPITNVYTGVTTNAVGALAATLADGAVGQIKVVKLTTKDTNNCVLTPANLTGGTTITFDATGECAILMFVGSAWVVLYTNATLA